MRRSFLTMVPLLLGCAAASAMADERLDHPKPQLPSRSQTQKALDEREALDLFAQGVLCEREDQLLAAIQAYEKAAQLDPDSVTINKSLMKLYAAVGRQDEAATLLEKLQKLNPRDPELSYLYARLLRSRGLFDQACAVLREGLKSDTVRDRPDLQIQMEYDLGVLQERLEQFEDAAAAFDRAAAILDNPDSILEGGLSPTEIQARCAELLERVGRNALDARQFDKAAAAFRRAQAAYPAGAGRLYYYLTQVSIRQGKLNEAVESQGAYLKTLPQDIDSYELMIGLKQKLRRDAEIVPWLARASDHDKFNVPLRLLLARQAVRAGEIASAETIYLELAASGPSSQIYRDLFRLYMDHDPAGADKVGEMVSSAFEKAMQKENALTNNPAPAQAKAMVAALQENSTLARDVMPAIAALAERQPLQINALQVFAALADRLDMLPEAEVLYRQCIQQPLPAVTEPLIYGGMLRVLWKARHFDAVVQTCRIALDQAQASNRVLLRAELARALCQLANYQEALEEADKALEDGSQGEQFAIRRLRVSILTRADKFSEAEAECHELLKDHELPADVVEIRYLLSNVYSQWKRISQAEAELAECLKIDPENVAVNNDLGYMWADRNKNLAEAEVMIRKAIELDRKARQGAFSPRPDAGKDFQDNACYVDSLGWVMFRRGQLKAACKELEYATSLPDGDDPAIWDHLGDVYQALGKRQKARSAWRKALHFYDGPKQHKMDERWQALREKVKSHNVKEAPCQAIPTGQRSSTKKEPSTPNAASCGAS
jgi:tetratricopeptide (TPR) repeat protein